MVDICWLCSLLGGVAGHGGEDIVPESEIAQTEEPPPKESETETGATTAAYVDSPTLELVPPGADGEGGESEAEEKDEAVDVE